MSLEVELRERVARRAVHLLPQPQTALRLQKLVADPHHTLAQVVDVVKQDPMLAAAVIRIANAASHARGAPVTSLAAAVTRIGERDLSRLALASGLGAATTRAGPLQALRRAAMQDALTSALICERLARELGFDPEALFLEGLLHDVGGLVAFATLELIVAQQLKPEPLTADAWVALAQAHHVELGTLLSEKWGLPVSVHTVIATHHDASDGTLDAATLVRWSDELLARLRTGASLVEAELPLLERLRPDRRAQLLEALAAVPALVAAFDEDRGPSEVSAVISGPPPPPTAEGFWIKGLLTGGREAEVQLAGERRLTLRTRQPLPDNRVAELRLELPDEVLAVWVRITFADRVGLDGYAIAEAVPFAPSKEVAERLDALWAALTHLEVDA